MNSLLSISDLSIQFKTEHETVDAVKSVSFELEQGKTLGIVGESGSGKSVTSLSVMRLLPAKIAMLKKGSILFEGENGPQDLVKLNAKKMQEVRGKDIAMIFQEPMTSLNPVKKCGKQVLEAILTHQDVGRKEAKQKVMELFNEVKLPRPDSIYNSYPHEISGGQKQRVMIAMALSCNPKILIADEPTTALDVTVQKTILELLKELQQRFNMSIIFITHDLGVIAEVANEVIVMYKGEIVESGTVEQIFKSAQHPYTKGLIACRPTLDMSFKVLPTVQDYLEQKEEDAPFFAKFGRKQVFTIQDGLKPILEVNGLKTYFPIRKKFLQKEREYVKAVDDVSFSIYPSETLGLVGESGCGKTTLGRTILQLNKPTAGEVYFDGKRIDNLDKKGLKALRKDIQIIFQDPYSSLNPRLPVGSAIAEPMKTLGIYTSKTERKAKTMELLVKVGLQEDHYYRYPHEFSGGQRQRICIARALAVEPRFIICDESVSALDVSVQAQVLNLLNQLKEEFGFTYIFISHDLSVVKFMSDRMAVMKDGRIVEMGIAEEIYKHPQTKYTQTLIEAIPQGI